jgi:hypothetical protein
MPHCNPSWPEEHQKGKRGLPKNDTPGLSTQEGAMGFYVDIIIEAFYFRSFLNFSDDGHRHPGRR